MSNARNKALIAVQAILIALFVIALILGMGATSVKAVEVSASGTSASESANAQYIDGLKINGNVGTYNAEDKYKDDASTPLFNEDDIRLFLQGSKPIKKRAVVGQGEWIEQSGTTAKIGYLAADNISYRPSVSENVGYFTNTAMAGNLTFDGAGKTLNLTASKLNDSSPWIKVSDTVTESNIAATFMRAEGYDKDNNKGAYIDISSAFVGYVPASSNIINTNFVYGSTVSGSYSTSEAGCGGIVAGFCCGVIDNCSLTVNGSFGLTVNPTGGDATAKCSYAFGGFAGMLVTSGARVSNSSINLTSSGSFSVTISKDKTNRRIYLGGIAGYMGNQSQAYNLTTAGSGQLTAQCGGSGQKNYTALGFVGIVAGSCAGDPIPGSTRAITGATNAGTINGVVNTWTGKANYSIYGGSISNSDAGGSENFSPHQANENSGTVYGMIVGLSGAPGKADSVSNIYVLSNLHDSRYADSSSDWYTIGANFVSDTTTQHKKDHNTVNLKRRIDDDNTLGNADSRYAYLTWSNTTSSSNVLAVYDIRTEAQNHILWANKVDLKDANGVTQVPGTRQTYYDQCKNLNELESKYSVTYTELTKGAYPIVDIAYEFGYAAFMKMSFEDSYTQLTGSNVITGEEQLDPIPYGGRKGTSGRYLEIPNIYLYNNAQYQGVPTKLSYLDLSNWKTSPTDSKNLLSLDSTKDVNTEGHAYETFVYLEGERYQYIHLIDEAHRLVAYIEDDANYQTFAAKYLEDNGEEYSIVNPYTGKKNYDWQPKIKQTVVAREVNIDFKRPQDVQFDPIETNKHYLTRYEGKPIVYTATVSEDDLVNNDDVNITLEYFTTDDNYTFDEANKVEAVMNVGKYLIHALRTTNTPNYVVADSVEDQRLDIERRAVNIDFNDDYFEFNSYGDAKYTYETDADGNKIRTYQLELDYNGDSQEIEQMIDKTTDLSFGQNRLKANGLVFALYNIGQGDYGNLISWRSVGIDGDYDYDSINVPDIVGDASYKLTIMFKDGPAKDNYQFPQGEDDGYEIIEIIVTIAPVGIEFDGPKNTSASNPRTYTYGERALDAAYYSYGNGVEGKVAPTGVKYEKLVNNVWEELIDSNNDPVKPENVGQYRVTYVIANSENRNYATSVYEYHYKINQRPVTFTPDDSAGGNFTYFIQDEEINSSASGLFGRYVTNGSNINNGLLDVHRVDKRLEWRYKLIGNWDKDTDGLPEETLSMSDIYNGAEYLSRIVDVGCYLAYPVIMLKCNNEEHSHHGSGDYFYDPDRCGNYKFTFMPLVITVKPLDVSVVLYNDTTEYSKEIVLLSGKASDDAETRGWDYVTNIYGVKREFDANDKIVAILTSEGANTSNPVGHTTPITVDHWDSDIEGVNKSGNYDIKWTNATLTVTRLNITVYTSYDSTTREYVYGQKIPTPYWKYNDDNKFAEDEVYSKFVYIDFATKEVYDSPENVGEYNIGVKFDDSEEYLSEYEFGNYYINILSMGTIKIIARKISVSSINVKTESDHKNDAGEWEFTYNGKIQRPETTFAFDDESGLAADENQDGFAIPANLKVGFKFINEDGEKVDAPQNAGLYSISDVDTDYIFTLDKDGNSIYTNNYEIVDVNDEFDEVKVRIKKLEVRVKVNDAMKIYHIDGTLQALKADKHVVAGQEVAPSDLIRLPADGYYVVGNGEVPFTYDSGSPTFIEEDYITAALYVEEFEEEVGVHNSKVQIVFYGDAIDAKNYDIKLVSYGNLLVNGSNFEDIDQFLFLTFNGKKVVDEVVDSESEIDKNEIVYTGSPLDISLYCDNENIYNKISLTFLDKDGNVVDKIVNAGNYTMVLSGDEETFHGDDYEIPFVVRRAVRNITEEDIVVKVHYNKLEFSSHIVGLGYKINDDKIYMQPQDGNVYVYENNVTPLNNYSIKVTIIDGDDNYETSNVLELFVRTGINASDLAARINAIKTVTFSNLSVYRALKAQLGDVHADDMDLIDSDHIAALDAQIDKLLSDASAVIAGAQNVAAKTAGKSNNSTSATAMALSSASLGIGVAGLMLGIIARKRKEDEAVKEERKEKKANGKKNAKRFLSVIAIMLVAVMTVMAFAGCNDDTMKQEEILDLASYKVDSGEKSREYEITVSHGSTIVYRNVNGVESSDDNVSAPSFALGASGSGLDFNVDYFKNVAFVTSKTTATFDADVENVSAFLGIANATNATVRVTANVDPKRLTSIEIEYYVDGFKTQIITTLTY